MLGHNRKMLGAECLAVMFAAPAIPITGAVASPTNPLAIK